MTMKIGLQGRRQLNKAKDRMLGLCKDAQACFHALCPLGACLYSPLFPWIIPIASIFAFRHPHKV